MPDGQSRVIAYPGGNAPIHVYITCDPYWSWVGLDAAMEFGTVHPPLTVTRPIL